MNKVTYEERAAIYEKALWAFGAESQIMMAVEEMSELTKELCKRRRGKMNAAELAEEIADVTIMLEQLRLIFGLNDGVCEQMDAKVRRLEEKIAEREAHAEADASASDRFAEAFGNIAWYNGHEEWLWELSDRLKAISRGQHHFFSADLPPDCWLTDRHALWMMLVSAFGSWGTSIRSGWIERAAEAADFIDAATERFAEDR